MKNLSKILLLLLMSYNIQNPSLEQLYETDLAFSSAAAGLGFNKAFIEYAHPDAILLRENSMPIVGKQNIIKIFENADTSGVKFSWEPLSGEISQSGDLGFTYGIYSLTKDTLTSKGTYVSIWKKDFERRWKYILDTGNEGLGNKKQ